MNFSVNELINSLWNRRLAEALHNGEVVELCTYDGNFGLLDTSGQRDGWEVRAIRHRPSELGRGKKIKRESVFIPYIDIRRSRGAAVDHFAWHLDMLLRKFLPPFKPKSWRMFNRPAKWRPIERRT
jgi:hypothetical protein